MKISLLLTSAISILALTSCNSDKSGDYKLVDMDFSSSTIDQRKIEKSFAEGLGSIWHIEKVGDYYKLSMEGEPDILVFSPDGNDYSAKDGRMTLKFTSSGAIIHGKDVDKEATWTLEKQ
ncbi:MAG: hypothetical protein HDR88_14570 [Bacteroides sp.]|nr:hypothetical protein [Bacteroides sp.]